jgi:hypothetical protein
VIRSSFRSFLIISKSDRHHFGFAIQSEFEHSTGCSIQFLRDCRDS